MGILAHNSLMPQATREESSDPKPVCSWDMCSVPGRALMGSAQLASCENGAGARCLDRPRGFVANPGSTHWTGTPGNFKTPLIWPNLTSKRRRDAYHLQRQSSPLLAKCYSKVCIGQNTSDKYLAICFGKTTIYSHSLKYLNPCWNLTPISPKEKEKPEAESKYGKLQHEKLI